MKSKIIIIFVMILLIPIALADFIEITSEIPAKTSNEKLCVSGTTNSGNTIRFFIDEGSSPRDIIMTDGSTRSSVTLDNGIIDNLCVALHTGKNNVKITSTGQYAVAEKEILIDYDNSVDSEGLDNFDSIPDTVNTKNPKFTITINEDSTLIITINGQQTDSINLNTGDNEIQLNLDEGENIVNIKVRDNSENEITSEKTITVDTTKPSVTIDSVDGKPYTANMKTDFSNAEIIGKTEPDSILKYVNLNDTSYKYDKAQDKFLKDGEEIITEIHNVVLDSDGNFKTYVNLIPGKNKIVFLAEDEVGNINDQAGDVDNIKSTLILNYEGGNENWNFKVEVPEKIKGKDMVQGKNNARVKITVSPKRSNINLEQLKNVRVKLTRKNKKGHNQYITPGESQTSYFKEKNAYITYQDFSINWPGRTLDDIPDVFRANLNGNIGFHVGDSPDGITEHIPIDLLFYTEVDQTKLLAPIQEVFSKRNIDGYLVSIKHIIDKYLQPAIVLDAKLCAADLVIRFLLGQPPGQETWGLCDRIACWDTPPKKKDKIRYLGASRSYIPPSEETTPRTIFDETKCLPNMLRSENPWFAPVRVKDDLVESTKCLCLTGMWTHLQKIYQTLSAMQGCLHQARLGSRDPGECDVQIAQYSCDLLFGFVNNIYELKQKRNETENPIKNIFGKPDAERYNTDRDPINFLVGFVKSMATKSLDLQKLTQFNYLEPLSHKSCTVLASQNWELAKDIVIPTTMELTPSYGKLITRSSLIREGQNLVIEYTVAPMLVAGLHDVRYNIELYCDPNMENGHLCIGADNSYARDKLQPDIPLAHVTLPAGASLPGIIRVKDRNPKYWFNKIKLELERYVTATSQPITDVKESDIKFISSKNLYQDTELTILCGKLQSKPEICEKAEKSCIGSGYSICDSYDQCIGDIVETEDVFYPKVCCKTECVY